MPRPAREHRVENLEHRMTSVEQILPTLATKADLQAAVAPLATRAELADLKAEMEVDLAAAIAPLATRAELVDLKAEMKADLAAAIAPLATKAEMRAEIKAEAE